MKRYLAPLSLLAFSTSALADQAGQQTSFPAIEVLDNLKHSTNPTKNINLSSGYCDDGDDPDKAPALAKAMCFIKNGAKLNSLGTVTGIGFSAGSSRITGNLKTILDRMQASLKLGKASSDGFDYKLEQWWYETNNASKTHKSLQYWFSEGGSKGRVETNEFMPADADLKDFEIGEKYIAAVYSWDSTNPAAQTLSWRWQRSKDNTSKSFSNTEYAIYSKGVINSTANTAEVVSISYSAMGTNPPQAYKFRTMRNSTHTLFEGYICSADGSSCSTPTFQCVDNSTKIITSIGDDYTSVNTGGCAGFSSTGFTIDFIEPTQAKLDLLNDQSGALTKLDPNEAFTP